MNVRFVCPHCHASLDPAAMDRAVSDLAEYRICPACDEPVFFAVRERPAIPDWLRRDGASGGVTETPEQPVTDDIAP